MFWGSTIGFYVSKYLIQFRHYYLRVNSWKTLIYPLLKRGTNSRNEHNRGYIEKRETCWTKTCFGLETNQANLTWALKHHLSTVNFFVICLALHTANHKIRFSNISNQTRDGLSMVRGSNLVPRDSFSVSLKSNF